MTDAGIARIQKIMAGQEVVGAERVEVLAPPGGAPAWTAGMVYGELREAYATIAQTVGRVGPAGARSSMPEVVRDYNEAYGADAAAVRPGTPAGWRIDRAEKALTWLLLVDDVRDRRAVGGVAAGASLAAQARKDGRSPDGLVKAVKRRLTEIATELNRRGWKNA